MPAAKPTPKRKTNPKDSHDRLHSPAVDAIAPQFAQEGDRLTTAQGLRVTATNDSLKAGNRGPTLIEDFHFREKITHFDHERIPERVVHARGAAAHGHFQVYESLAKLTSAGFLDDPNAKTPVFVRFSTVAGSRGSADTARDVRGFATKFYTTEGNFDLVGNNIPIFFIQDAIKFPDLIHSVKPEPDREIPQAQSAHDTFWDFAGLQPESTHMLMWAMSDRAIPRSFRTMEGFGIHTFRLVNAKGKTSLVKFHWKPAAGKHSLVWEESQKLGGIDPDFHRRDLWDAIEAGAGPEYELGLQIMPDSEDQMFEGIDLLDPTKIVPEELCPVQLVGKMVLDTNPTNFFAETEQVAFHPGHLVPGIGLTDDPLLQGRLFSYLDTQLTRLGGPNFSQIPVNRPVADVNDNHRDGFGQQAVHEGKAAYFPNSTGGGCPFLSTATRGRVRSLPEGSRRPEGGGARGQLRGSLQPGDPVLEQHEPSGEGPHSRRILVRAVQGGGTGDPGADAGQPGQRRRRIDRTGGGQPGYAGAEGQARQGRRGVSGAVDDPEGAGADQWPGDRAYGERRRGCGRAEGPGQGVHGGRGEGHGDCAARRVDLLRQCGELPGGEDCV